MRSCLTGLMLAIAVAAPALAQPKPSSTVFTQAEFVLDKSEVLRGFRVGITAGEQAEDLGLARRDPGSRPGGVVSRAQALEHYPGDTGAHRGCAGTQLNDLRHQIRFNAVLEHVANRASLHAGEHVALVAEHRDHHDVALRHLARRMADHFRAVHVGQAKVDEQHVGPRRREACHGFAAGADRSSSTIITRMRGCYWVRRDVRGRHSHDRGIDYGSLQTLQPGSFFTRTLRHSALFASTICRFGD
jgi:hypothetical protein